MRRLLLRRVPIAAAALLLVAAVGFFVVRDSSMFAVRDVTVRGVSGPDGPKIEASLREAARDMSTLHVDADKLTRTVRTFSTVKSIGVRRDLPHGLTLVVHEKRAVATVERGGQRVPLAADGRLLQGSTPPKNLPALDLKDITGPRIADRRGRQLVALVAAAPNALRARASRAEITGKGLTLTMDRGPDLFFGTPENLAQKWRAAARVLADPAAEGASYIDVRVPGRPAAGGLAPLASPDGGEETPAPAAPSPSTGA